VTQHLGNTRSTKVWLSLVVLYLVWGCNFLAIRYAVESVPPFLLMGVRSLLAGACLYAWARLRGAEPPSQAHWRTAAAVGTVLFLGCHGLLAWAQRRVPSGVAALGLATTPLWMTLLDWLWARGQRPARAVWIGIALGLLGLGTLVGPGAWNGGVDLVGLTAVLIGALAWAAGSILSRRSPHQPRSVVLATGMQLLAGGLALMVVSVTSHDAAGFDPTRVSLRSALAFGYMIGLASILGFTAYVWLLRVAQPALVGSYAFVNPLVAVLVGWAFGGEPLSARTGLATLLIVAGVAAIVERRQA
jgi:drug/metabolite transporter (DMT)-like permease